MFLLEKWWWEKKKDLISKWALSGVPMLRRPWPATGGISSLYVYLLDSVWKCQKRRCLRKIKLGFNIRHQKPRVPMMPILSSLVRLSLWPPTVSPMMKRLTSWQMPVYSSTWGSQLIICKISHEVWTRVLCFVVGISSGFYRRNSEIVSVPVKPPWSVWVNQLIQRCKTMCIMEDICKRTCR